ncbi:MAG: N-acetylneuraminate synthase family protein [Pseudomonadota bacterium]
MIISNDIHDLVVSSDQPIRVALERINGNRLRGIFVVDGGGHLLGVMTDGDFRRWLIAQSAIDLEAPVVLAANDKVRYARVDDEVEKISALLSPKITAVPLVDEAHRLVAVATSGSGYLRIGDKEIGPDRPAFLIAEIGNNHNGDMNLARRLIDEAIAAGADCVKFQMRDLTSIYGEGFGSAQDLGVEYTLDLLLKYNLPPEKLFELFDYASAHGVLPLCTPWDLKSLELLDGYGMPAFKMASADLTNSELMEAAARRRKPLIVSTGMSRESEIRSAVQLLRRHAAQVVFLHCNSAYPAPFEDVNLNFLPRLQAIGECPVGYSSHERGVHVCVAAVAMGARVIEKHFTLDREMEGSDHKVSLLPHEFAELVQGVRQTESALGLASREISQGELLNREALAKSLVAAVDIAEDAVVTAEMMAVRSPGRGLQPIYRDRLVGRTAPRAMKAGDFFYPSDLSARRAGPGSYRFRRPWGIPVRYHDHRALYEKARPDLLEYHLSYRDLDEDLSAHFTEPLDCGFVVHAPELLREDHVLDLCAADPAYRALSIDWMHRIIEAAASLIPYHAPVDRVLLITNVGGFSEDAPLSDAARQAAYDRLAEALATVAIETVEVIPQTMPPYPWHFGGQRFHNLFVSPEDIVAFCQRQGMRICLDVSHSQLACNHLKLEMSDLVDAVGPHVAHLHLADARGLHGEGLQIGEGEMSFSSLAQHLDRSAPHASFIPEVWQGHKNAGEGFWIALDRLSRHF